MEQLREYLNFDTKQALKAWMQNPNGLVQPVWQEYWKSCLTANRRRHRSRSQKVAELRNAILAIAQGEGGFNRRYSRRYRDKSGWQALDHKACLLYDLMTENSDDRDGIFYQSQLSKRAKYERMWEVIERLIYDSAISRYLAAPSTATAEYDDNDDDNDDANTLNEPQRLPLPECRNKRGGQVMALWDCDMPSDTTEEGEGGAENDQTIKTFDQAIQLETYADLEAKLESLYSLKEHHHRIHSIASQGKEIDEENYPEFQKRVRQFTGSIPVVLCTKYVEEEY